MLHRIIERIRRAAHRRAITRDHRMPRWMLDEILDGRR